MFEEKKIYPKPSYCVCVLDLVQLNKNCSLLFENVVKRRVLHLVVASKFIESFVIQLQFERFF